MGWGKASEREVRGDEFVVSEWPAGEGDGQVPGYLPEAKAQHPQLDASTAARRMSQACPLQPPNLGR